MKENTQVDYPQLLAKYISHVRREEGIDFLGKIDEDTGIGFFSDIRFTDEERKALNEAAKRPID